MTAIRRRNGAGDASETSARLAHRRCGRTPLPGVVSRPPRCDTEVMRFFNTEGPVRPEKHYSIPPLARWDLDDMLALVRDEKYFVLHAPRQTGKTSTLLALRNLLNDGAEGDYRCVYANVEAAQASREDVERGMRSILSELRIRVRTTLRDDSMADVCRGVLESAGPDGALREVLTRWSEADPRPLVLLIDEIDSLIGDTLLSVLRQLRSGYDQRPASFPQSVILCGVRDVRDYRIHSGSEKAVITGGSTFNIKSESLRLGDFTESDVQTLLAQHTEETDQAFAADALDAVWMRTQGQPWLVNALCYQACFRNRAGRDRSRPIVLDDILEAQEQLILRRETHLDQLADKLQEDRVRRVVEPMLSAAEKRSFSARDIEYARDLGLIARHGPLRIANPVYAEVVPRELTYAAQEDLVQDTAWYVDADGGLDMEKLLTAFQTFFREHSEHWVGRFDYLEAGPQLLLQAFLQRVVNGGGRIEREYGLGRGRTDLLILWPQGGRTRRFVIECKLRRGEVGKTIHEGVRQTLGYMDRCGAEAGHLVVFDRSKRRCWKDKVFRREESADGGAITVWGM